MIYNILFAQHQLPPSFCVLGVPLLIFESFRLNQTGDGKIYVLGKVTFDLGVKKTSANEMELSPESA